VSAPVVSEGSTTSVALRSPMVEVERAGAEPAAYLDLAARAALGGDLIPLPHECQRSAQWTFGGSDLRGRELIAAVVALIAAACGASALESSGATYRRDHDCASLVAIARDVKGTSASRVRALLGPPEYEPTSGQHYYSSSRSDCSLVLDYRHDDQVTNTVQDVEVGAIGE